MDEGDLKFNDMPLTAENLEYAVSVFYSGEHGCPKQAHRWLTQAQRRPEAWSFVWDLLDSSKSTEVQFFAATTLHAKLRKFWAEIPKSSYDELKNRIMQAVCVTVNGPKIVLNRLCISLAAFILHQGGHGVIETVQQLSVTQNVALILEFLSVVPGEFECMYPYVKEKVLLRTNLQHFTDQILNLVMEYLQIDNCEMSESLWNYKVNIWQASCHCAASWIQLGGVTPRECIPVVTASLQAMHAVYRGRQPPADGKRDELSHSELETCEGALKTAIAALTQPDACRHPTSCCQLFRLFTDAVEPILEIEDKIHTANEDLVVAIYNAAVTTAENHGIWMATSLTKDLTYHRDENFEEPGDQEEAYQCANKVVRLMLCCSGAAGTYPTQETHSKLAFSFWFGLQDDGLVGTAIDYETEALIKEGLRISYEQLVTILLRKSTYPPPPFEFNNEDDESMRCYRQDISDTFVYCHNVLGNNLMTHLENLLRSGVDNCLADGGCGLEATLNAYLAVADFVPVSSNASLIALMRVLIKLPYDKLHQQVMNTAFGCFISYAGWLSLLEESIVVELLGPILNITWMGIENKDFKSVAILALKALCQECQDYLAPHAHQLLQAIQNKQDYSDPSLTSTLMIVAGYTASMLPTPEAAPYINNLITPLVEQLQITQRKSVNFKKIAHCCTALQHATSLITALLTADGGMKHAYMPLTLLLPTFGSIVQHSELVPPLFKFIKHFITRLQSECLLFVPDLVKITNISLTTFPEPENIDVSKMIIILFPEVSGNMLSVMVESILRICGETLGQEQSLSIHSPVLTSFFSSLAIIALKKPANLSRIENQTDNLVKLALMTMGLPENGPSKATCNYFDGMIKAQPAVFFNYCPALIHRMLHCIGGLVPRNQVEYFSDLLWKLLRNPWTIPNPGETAPGQSVPGQGLTYVANWLKEALETPGFPTDLATPEVKEKFMKAVVRNYSHKRNIGETVREFSLTCRGLIGEYGDMTKPLLF